MLLIFDESYNLKDRSKPQFISINGFMVLDPRPLFKKWKELRQPFVGGRRIHASDPTFHKLRLKVLNLIRQRDLILLTVFQIIQEIPLQKDRAYFQKGKLNFDKLYSDLLKALLLELNLGEFRNVNIVIDSRKHKVGILGKKHFKKDILKFFKKQYSKTKMSFDVQPSATNILLELADFISNIFYRAYINNDEKFFEDLKFKLVQIKNPLK